MTHPAAPSLGLAGRMAKAFIHSPLTPLLLLVPPTATILPFACSATSNAKSEPPKKSVVCLPSPEKLGSSEPFGV